MKLCSCWKFIGDHPLIYSGSVLTLATLWWVLAKYLNHQKWPPSRKRQRHPEGRKGADGERERQNEPGERVLLIRPRQHSLARAASEHSTFPSGQSTARSVRMECYLLLPTTTTTIIRASPCYRACLVRHALTMDRREVAEDEEFIGKFAQDGQVIQTWRELVRFGLLMGLSRARVTHLDTALKHDFSSVLQAILTAARENFHQSRAFRKKVIAATGHMNLRGSMNDFMAEHGFSKEDGSTMPMAQQYVRHVKEQRQKMLEAFVRICDAIPITASDGYLLGQQLRVDGNTVERIVTSTGRNADREAMKEMLFDILVQALRVHGLDGLPPVLKNAMAYCDHGDEYEEVRAEYIVVRQALWPEDMPAQTKEDTDVTGHGAAAADV